MFKLMIVWRSAVATVLFFCLNLSPCWSQSCVYNFVETFQTYGSSNGTLYSSVSVVDNSGCNHSAYQTTARVSLPNGQSSQSPAEGGLQATVSIIPLDPGPSGTGFVTVSPSTSGTFYCPVYHGTAGFGGGQPVTMSWASVFALPNDGQNMVFTQSDFNYLVSQNVLPAAAGTVVLVTQPELYPIVTTAIVIVGLAYITYQVAKKIAQAVQTSNVHPINITQPCYEQLYECIEYPNQPNTGYGSTKDCSSCYRECVNAGGVWPYYKCQSH